MTEIQALYERLVNVRQGKNLSEEESQRAYLWAYLIGTGVQTAKGPWDRAQQVIEALMRVCGQGEDAAAVVLDDVAQVLRRYGEKLP